MGTRVCDIKKKFEDMTEAIKEQRPDPSTVKTNVTKHLSCHAKKTVENGSSSNSSTSRGLIKRSHAFRSDKPIRNLYGCENACPEKSLPKWLSPIENDKEMSDKLISKKSTRPKKELHSISPEKSTSKSNNHSLGLNHLVAKPRPSTLHITTNSPTQYNEGKMKKNVIKNELNNDTGSSVLKILVSSKSNPEHDKNIKEEDGNLNKQIDDELGKDEQVNVSLSSTLKKVLKSPLPSGPPPKKPPRTFAYFMEKSAIPVNGESYSGLSTDDINLNLDIGRVDLHSTMKPIRSKTESQIMLKKLELALQNHKTQGKIIEPKMEINQLPKSKEVSNKNENNAQLIVHSCDRPNNITHVHSPAVRKTSLPDTPNDRNNYRNGCFGVLSCSNSMDLLKTTHIYDTPVEVKSQFYLDDFVGSQTTQNIVSKENLFKTNSFHYGKIKLNDNQEPIYAKPSVKNHLKNLKCEKGPSVLQIVKSLNSNEKIDLKKVKSTNYECKKTQPLHYMSSPVWEKVPLLQSPPTPSASEKSLVSQKRLFDKSGAKSFPSRSYSLDIDGTNAKAPSARSFSIDYSHGERDFQIENQKIQKMVNEVYSKCLAMPQDSDSESVASTPDESTSKPLPANHTSPEEVQKNRQQRAAERKTYLKRVCSRARSFHRPSVTLENHLFEYLLLVGLDLDPARCKVPYIKAKYPTDADVPRGIEHLCFPDATDWPPQVCADDDRCYCVVITHSSGTRKYGYCRRVQPEGAPICLPLAYCIVSPYKANYYFSQVLKELESRHGQPEQTLSSFIQELYECPFPAPGQGLHVTQPATGDKVEILTRKLDPRQEETDIARLLNLVRYSVFLQLFSTLLLERKVILLSYSISKLSTCFEGLCAALYPFHWQHTLVPIVPSSMLDVCQAPTPYVIGLLKPRDANAQPPVVYSTIDQVLVVDVDESRVLHCCGDESSVLPPRLSRGLREALLCAVPDKHAPLSPAHNLVASEALIALFVQLVGHYRDHIITSSATGQREFQRESFIKSVSSGTVQSFLDWFTETTMFTAFIESRLDRSVEPYGLFEQRCVEHLAQQQAVSSKGYRANINKTVKSFGDRFKEWTNSS